MTKNDFLKQQDVSYFSNWLGKTICNQEGHEFNHAYVTERRGSTWSCHSLFNAYENYSWEFSFQNYVTASVKKGSSYSESEAALLSIKDNLLNSIASNDNDRCYEACIMVLDWGGVLGSDTHGNKKKLNGLKTTLCEYLLKIQELFDKSAILTVRYVVNVQGTETPVIMNAGFTKIYSLLCDNFIIYDGRVGGALGFLVRKFLEHTVSNAAVPDNLHFYYGKAKNANVNRNPSYGPYQFKSLSTPAVHIRNNLKANWIIKAVLDRDAGEFKKLENPMRAFEASLFMIGYKL